MIHFLFQNRLYPEPSFQILQSENELTIGDCVRQGLDNEGRTLFYKEQTLEGRTQNFIPM